MDIKKLFSGVAVIIDDKINKRDSGDLILNIRDKLKENNIPILEYEDIPDEDEMPNFKNISFILLDWELFEKPKEAQYFDDTQFINANIDFIKKIKKIAFAPIFIFSHLLPETIIRKLNEENLYKEDSNNYIFVKMKSDLFSKDRKRFLFWSNLKKWLNHTPSIYVLKEWEQALNKAKRDLFWSFYEINHNWPSVLQKTFTDDGSDVNYELGNFIYKNIMTRTEPIEFDEEILKLEDDQINNEDLRKVLEAERFIKEPLPRMPFTGDLFEYEVKVNDKKEKRYYLNIRPECDIAIRNNGTSNPNLYCLKGGKIVNEELINSKKEEHKEKRINFIKGSFIEPINKIYLPFIIDGIIIEFSLNDIKIKKWNDLKTTRVGRVLPPYITRVQQQYSFYLQRQGLPAIPKEAISTG